MPELHVPWQSIVAILVVCSGLILLILPCIGHFARCGVKPCDKLAGCGGSTRPKIVPLIDDEGRNMSLVGRKANKPK